MHKILLTGYSGFVGSHLLNTINSAYALSLLGRTPPKYMDFDFHQSELNELSDFSESLTGVNTVIHCAARAHIMNDNSQDPLTEFRKINTHGTVNLAKQAASTGVKRFIFISSIKVNGEFTEPGTRFKEDDIFIPTDPYGLSKYEAEVDLRRIADETGMEVVIIRPVLVYGPGVKANFSSMMKWVKKGLPLPLGGIKQNKRSLVSIDNLVDFIVTCIEHPNAANQTFLVSDNEDLSTTGLLNSMAIALNVPNRLIPIPASWFKFSAQLIGKPAIAQRLCGSLQVDISKAKELLNWTPPYSRVECMKKTASAFLENLNKRNDYE